MCGRGKMNGGFPGPGVGKLETGPAWEGWGCEAGRRKG